MEKNNIVEYTGCSKEQIRWGNNNDFLDNLGAQQHEKMIEKNASKEDYYNSQSEGKEFNKNSQEKESNS